MQAQTVAVKTGRLRRGVFIATAAFVLLLIGYLAVVVREELNILATATSDNVQWSLSQAEVEHLALLNELQKARLDPEADLSQLRRRFDIFYSRVSTLQSSPLFTVFRTEQALHDRLERLRSFLDRSVPLIDGDDNDLKASLSDLTAEAALLRPDIRTLALEGIEYFSTLRDRQRGEIYRTLANIALLATALLVVLLILIFCLNRLNQINRTRLLQNALVNARMSAIVTTSLDAVIATDRWGRVMEFNGAAEDIFGYSRKEALGAKMADLIIPDHLRDAHEKGMKRYLETKVNKVVGKGRVRLEGKRKSGEIFPVEFNVNKAEGQDEGHEIFISYLRDISKEHEAENELLEARDAAIAGEESKSRLLAVMSHEMRTPLNGLLGTMELLSETKLSDRQERYLRIMSKSGNLLLSHVNDVLDISRIEAGRFDLDSSVFDLNTMISELIEGHRAVAKDNGNALNFNALENEQLLVNGDQLRLRQVLLNLIGNAVKFTREGQITVESERLNNGNLIEVRVIDTGVGIAAEDIDRVFDDFTTLDSSYGRRTDGTGLGLGIVRRIVNAMGGEVGVESEPGEGSLFWIRIPMAVQDDQISAEITQPGPERRRGGLSSSKPLDILLVEDNEINRMVVRDFLEADKHRINEAYNGAEGVAFAERMKFDLILMDISMPEMDGLEATRAIRAGDGPSRDTPIFALTAHALEEDVKNFIAAGMNEVVFKPVSKKSLRAAIGALKTLNPSQAADDGSEAPLVDEQVYHEFREDIGEMQFQQMFGKFILEMDEKLAALAAAPQGTPDLDIARTAHSLAGSAAMFGARALYHHLIDLETAAKSAPDGPHDAQIRTTQDVWSMTRDALEDMSG